MSDEVDKNDADRNELIRLLLQNGYHAESFVPQAKPLAAEAPGQGGQAVPLPPPQSEAPKAEIQEALQEERDAPLEIPEDFYPHADPRVRAAKYWSACALLRGDRVNSIVKRLGISNQTFMTWRREPDFYRFLKESVDLEFSEYTTALRTVAPRSVEVLAAAQEHSDPNVRIKAASRLLTSADRLLDRVAGMPAGANGTPLIIFPPGTQISLGPAAGGQALTISTPIDVSAVPAIRSEGAA